MGYRLNTRKKEIAWVYQAVGLALAIFMIGAIYFVQFGGVNSVNTSYVTSIGLLLLGIMKYKTNMVSSQLCILASTICSIPSSGGYELASPYILCALVGLLVAIIRLAIRKRRGTLSLKGNFPSRLEQMVYYKIKPFSPTIFWRLIILTFVLIAVLQMATSYISAGGYADLHITPANYQMVLGNAMIVVFPLISSLMFATNLIDAILVKLIMCIVYMSQYNVIYFQNPAEVWALYMEVVYFIQLVICAYALVQNEGDYGNE